MLQIRFQAVFHLLFCVIQNIFINFKTVNLTSEDLVKFTVELNHRVSGSDFKTIRASSIVECSFLCLHENTCWQASFLQKEGICQIDMSNYRQVGLFHAGWKFLELGKYIKKKIIEEIKICPYKE